MEENRIRDLPKKVSNFVKSQRYESVDRNCKIAV